MATVSVYSFQDADGNESGSYTTQSYELAKEHARRYNLRLIDNIYEWSEAVPVEGDDYTGTPSDEYSDMEVMQRDCHGTGSIDMLRCIDCNQSLGDAHLSTCQIAQDAARELHEADESERRQDVAQMAAETATWRLANP